MRILFVALIIFLHALPAFAGLGLTLRMDLGARMHRGEPVSATSYWNTARTDYWDIARTDYWNETRDTEAEIK